MQKHIQDIYVTELSIQSNLAKLAQGDINRILAVYRDPTVNGHYKTAQGPQTFRNLHSLLTHAANISKLFWPIVKKDEPRDLAQRQKRNQALDRGEFLRTLYGIGDTSPIAKRELRDHLEHFDERLDWLAVEREVSTTGKTYADMDIGPLEDLTVRGGVRPDFVIRNFNQDNLVFTFKGIHYDTVELALAIDNIYDKSQVLLKS